MKMNISRAYIYLLYHNLWDLSPKIGIEGNIHGGSYA